MGIHTEWVRYGEGKNYLGFAARPERATTPLPAVIVVQEAGGVDAHIEDVTRRIAAGGYFALAPDLFAVDGVRPPEFTRERLAGMMAFFNSLPMTAWMDHGQREAELAKLPKDDSDRLRETFMKLFAGGALQAGQYLPELHATARFLRESEPTRGQKVGVMGFCMGGGVSGLFACHDPELAAAAIFYGMPPEASLVSNVCCPVIGFYGGADKRITDNVPAFAEAMSNAGKSFESHVYDGVGHAFFNDNRPMYDAAAVRDSYARLLEFFRRHLG
jgi:carboxymethylenebutenolidase